MFLCQNIDCTMSDVVNAAVEKPTMSDVVNAAVEKPHSIVRNVYFFLLHYNIYNIFIINSMFHSDFCSEGKIMFGF